MALEPLDVLADARLGHMELFCRRVKFSVSAEARRH